MIIFTNNRAIRNYTKKLLNQNGRVENLISISDFNRKAIYIPDFININKLEREVIFNSVVKEIEGERIFNIDTNIFNFLSYSRYFFAFFSELSQEGVSIDNIKGADYYEDYQQHISILKTIKERYRAKMRELKYIDEIFTPLNYKLNLSYIKSIENIEFRFDGRLSNFQITLFKEIAEYTSVCFQFTRTKFNRGIDKQLDMELKPNYEYLIDFGKREILKEKRVGITQNINIYGFKNRFTQIGFVKERIYHFHEKLGVPLDEIGVILLDENFSKTLKIFDRKNGKGNLNFSMGDSIENRSLYKFLNAIYLNLENRVSKENLSRIKRVIGDSEELEKIYNFFSQNWYKSGLEQFQKTILLTLHQFPSDENILRKIVDTLKLFESENLKNLNLRTLFTLFFKEIRELTIDDTKGGKVTVQGLLETRGADYKAVIVLDFNDEVFPKKEEKDFFINSDIRREVKLPLLEDREALQKLYLQRLFQKAKYVSVSYVDSETTKISRFFHDFDLRQQKYISGYEKELIKIALPYGEEFSHWSSDENRVVLKYSFRDKPLSNHQMRTFHECPRSFYLSNILNIKEHSTDESISLLLGNTLHRVLQRVYSKQSSFLNKRDLYLAFERELKLEERVPKIYVSSWLQRIGKFIEREVERFKNGAKVYALEQSITIENYKGFRLTGKVDRVDTLPNGDLMLIDYKLSKPTEFHNFFNDDKRETDFQLLFYYTLLKERGERVSLDNLYYYNLSTGELIKNKRTLEDFDKALQHLEDISESDIAFDKSEKCSVYCGYKTICNV